MRGGNECIFPSENFIYFSVENIISYLWLKHSCTGWIKELRARLSGKHGHEKKETIWKPKMNSILAQSNRKLLFLQIAGEIEYMIHLRCTRDTYHNIPPSSVAFLVWRSWFALMSAHYSASVQSHTGLHSLSLVAVVTGNEISLVKGHPHVLLNLHSYVFFFTIHIMLPANLQKMGTRNSLSQRSTQRSSSAIVVHRCLSGLVVSNNSWSCVSLCILENPEKYLHWLVITLTFYLELLSMCVILHAICINHLVSNLIQPNRKEKDSVPDQRKGVGDAQASTPGNL